jgi:hypothetical protein
LEAKSFIERHSVIVNRVHDYSTNGDLLRCERHACECVVEERRADSLPLVAGINS